MKRAALFLSVLLLYPSLGEARWQGQDTPTTPQPRVPDQPKRPVRPIPREDSRPRDITIAGMVIVQTPRQPNQIMEVRLEGQAFQRIGFAYTDGAGRFSFRNIQLQADQIHYVVVEAEGFEPYRERIDRLVDLQFGGHITVVLEPLREVRSNDPANSLFGAVDVTQLNIPEDAVDEYQRAVEDAEKGDTDKSIERLLKALEIAPEYTEAHNKLGSQYNELGRFDDARAAFEKAREANPPWAIPVINLGMLLYQRGEASEAEDGNREAALPLYVQAVDILEEAILMDRLSPTAHFGLGVALYKTSDYPRAESMLNLALELSPDMDEAPLSLVNVYSRQRRYVEALDAANRFIERNPDDPRSEALERVRVQLLGLLDSQ